MWRSWRWDRRWGVGVGWAERTPVLPSGSGGWKGGEGTEEDVMTTEAGASQCLWAEHLQTDTSDRRGSESGSWKKEKLGEKRKKKLTRQHSEMEPSKVNLSPDPQSQWLCLFMVTLPSFFPKSLTHPYHRDSTVKSSGSGFSNDTGETPPTERHVTSACRLGEEFWFWCHRYRREEPEGRKKKTVADRTMSFVMVCWCFQFASCWLGLLEKEGPALLSGKQNIFFFLCEFRTNMDVNSECSTPRRLFFKS